MTWLTAHSGSEGQKPNSREYIMTAIAYQADYIEIDVRHTVDGHLVLSHDDCYQGYVLSQSRYSDVSHTGILTFEEAVEMILDENLKVNADIKTMESINPVAEFVMKHDMVREVLLTGCASREVAYLHKHYPRIRKLYNVTDLVDTQSEGEKLAWILEMIKRYGAEGVNIPYQELTNERYHFLRYHDIDIYVWTVDEEREMRKNLQREVTSITTNQLRLFRTLKHQGVKA